MQRSDEKGGAYIGRFGDSISTRHRVAKAAFWRMQYASIMMEKLGQVGEGGGARPPPFHSMYHLVQSCSVRSS
jgi:hypothetical protein